MITIPVPFTKYSTALGIQRAIKAAGVPAVIKPCPAGWRVVITRKEFV